MEMEAKTPEVAKKLWNIVRVVFFMLRKGISKSRIMGDFNLMLKRGNKLAGKAIDDLIYNHHHNISSLSCRSGDPLAFVSPREYEFSCSNSPAAPPPHHKRKHLNFPKSYKYDDVSTAAAVQRMIEMLSSNEAAVDASPAPPMFFPGIGKSPMVRQLRITDSPFPVKDDGDGQVDVAAEAFIKKFYKDLKRQKNTTSSAFESPYHSLWAR